MRQRQVVTTTEVPNFIFQNVYITQTETATEPSFTSNKPYTLYKIEYEAWYLTEEEEFILQKKVVWRRFREFVNLHSRLENSDLYKKCIKDVKGPKKWLTMPFGIGNMGQENIDSRKSTLEVYLQTLCAKSELNTSAEMREFLAYAGDGNIAFVKKPPQVTQIDKVIVKTVSGVFDKLDKLVTVPTREKRAKLESTSPTTAADVELPEDTDALRIRSKAESEDQVLMTTALEELVSSHEAVGNEDGTVTCKDQRAASAGTEMLLSRLKHQLSIQEENKDLKLQDETLSSQPAAPVKNCDPNEKLSPGKSDKPQGSIFGKKMKDMTSNPGFLEDVNSDTISPLTNTDEVKNLKDCTVLDEPNATCLLTESRNVDHVSKSTEHVTATDHSKAEGEDLLDMTSQSESLLQTDIAQTAKDCTKVDPSKALLLTDLVVDLGLQTIDGSTSWVCYDLAISAFRTLLGRGVESFLQEAVASITTEERCAHYLQNLRELLWHDGKRPGDQEQPIISQMQYDVTRKQAERCLYEAYPGFLALLLDDEDLSMSVREIMATLDSVKLNKHLLFCLADALLEQLLPEVKTEELHIKLFKLDTRPPDGAT
ncbi:sorting nexin-19 [Lingula anatina]|uniref:Sorting nexin-19 n=1 Tax=Lingula anatina TaxID=7574 RepID=A0A1S3H593_LINAN|nr:sorting nexin-19 [Lingula anatina]|eukprot:XP_013380631.1 sorting nexin-19 [Lingula anatina]